MRAPASSLLQNCRRFSSHPLRKRVPEAPANGPHRVVDVDDHAPDGAALKLFRALCDKLPDLRKVFVPGVEGVFADFVLPSYRTFKDLLSGITRGGPHRPAPVLPFCISR